MKEGKNFHHLASVMDACLGVDPLPFYLRVTQQRIIIRALRKRVRRDVPFIEIQ